MFFLAAAALVAAPSFSSVPSADAWSVYVAAHRHQHRFALLLRKGEFQGPWLASEELLRPRANGELAVSVLEPETAAALWRAKDWQEAKWVLLGRDGSILLTGSTAPAPIELLDALRHSGWVPLKEQREAFLRQHPGQLEARLDTLREAANLALRRAAQAKAGAALGFKVTLDLEAADSEKKKDADVVWAEAAEALSDLGKQDGWPLASGLGTVLSGSGFRVRPRVPPFATGRHACLRTLRRKSAVIRIGKIYGRLGPTWRPWRQAAMAWAFWKPLIRFQASPGHRPRHPKPWSPTFGRSATGLGCCSRRRCNGTAPGQNRPGPKRLG